MARLEMLANAFHRQKQSFPVTAERPEAELDVEIRRLGVHRVHEKGARPDDLRGLQRAAHGVADQVLAETMPLLGLVDAEHRQNDQSPSASVSRVMYIAVVSPLNGRNPNFS